MDALLELFDQYRCHLIRGGTPSVVFLEDNFKKYIRDLTQASVPINNPLCGKEMCWMIKDNLKAIEENAYGLIGVLKKYDEGKIVTASLEAFDIFDTMKTHFMTRYSGAIRQEVYYRIRRIDDGQEFPIERRALFHISHNKNYLVGTERYSMPGHPCLYLSSQPELAWYECGKPPKFVVAKFDIPQEGKNCLKLIDFSEKLLPIKYSFFSWFHNEKDDIETVRKYLLKYLCTYPLRAACSVVAEHAGKKFVEEYIVPQLLLQWVVKDEEFDGVGYESCSSNEIVRSLGGHNIVLVTRKFDEDGFDIKLRKTIKIGKPEIIDVIEIEQDFRLDDQFRGKDIKEEPFHWNMEQISSEYDYV